jgi:hypothetical protein
VRKLVRNPVLLVVVGFMLMQAAWILTVPPFRGSDEFDHAYRAAAVADGEVIVNEWASDGHGLFVTVPRDLVEAARFQCERLDYTGPDNCVASEGATQNVRAASGAGLYHLAYYWFVGTMAKPFDGAAALYVMRLVSAGLCLLFIGLAAWSVTRVRSRWPLAALILAASPVLVYSTAIVAPNGLEMAAALALWSSALAALSQPQGVSTRRLLMIGVLAALVVCTLRMLGPLYVALTLICVVVANLPATRQIFREHRRAILVGAVIVVGAVAGAAAWVLANGQTGAPPDSEVGGSVNPTQLLVWNLQMIAAFPLRNQQGALVIYPVVLFLVGAIVSIAIARSGKGFRTAIVLSVAVTVLLPVALTLATMGDRGVIWQGRYLLPFGVGVVLLSGFALARTNRGGVGLRSIVPAALGLAAGVAACLVKVRNDEVAYGTESAWPTPPAYLLLILAVVALGAMAAAVGGMAGTAKTRDPIVEPQNV